MCEIDGDQGLLRCGCSEYDKFWMIEVERLWRITQLLSIVISWCRGDVRFLLWVFCVVISLKCWTCSVFCWTCELVDLLCQSSFQRLIYIVGVADTMIPWSVTVERTKEWGGGDRVSWPVVQPYKDLVDSPPTPSWILSTDCTTCSHSIVCLNTRAVDRQTKTLSDIPPSDTIDCLVVC